MKTPLPIFSVLFLLGAACETVVDIDIPFDKQMLVINSLPNPDSVWNVQVTLSRHVLDNTTHLMLPPMGVVKIVDQETEQVVDQLTQVANEPKMYRGTTKPSLGKTYRVQVDIPGYDRAEAIGYVPIVTPIESVETEQAHSDGSTYTRIKITFTDPPGESFYSVSLASSYFYIINMKDTVWNEYPIYIERDDAGLEEQGISGPEVLIDDTFFDGKKHTISVRLNGGWGGQTPLGPNSRLVFSSLGASFYKYKVTTNLQNAARDNPFAQPVQVFSNVKNGVGIFDGLSSYSWTPPN
ncbi:MAG: DUF4249 domain-containing protein [Bacteroidota bacterium]